MKNAITAEKLADHFYPVEEVRAGLVRCADELPQKTFYTYFNLSNAAGGTPFAVSDNFVDDEFAELLLGSDIPSVASGLIKGDLPQNRYGFTHVLYVPPAYHSELKGRLDAERSHTTLCIPIFEAEFSGSESAEDFIELRRHVVPTNDWNRRAAPKILLRFDNPASGSGTGDGYVFATFDMLDAEVKNLDGTGGFVEILNFRGQVVEILSGKAGFLDWIADRNDAGAVRVPVQDATARLWDFVAG